MTERLVESYQASPSALRFMSRALKRSSGLAPRASVPRIAVQWTGLRIDPAQLVAFGAATGLSETGGVPVLFPQVIGFRLQMALLTHRDYPFPIWTTLQVRNRLVRHTRMEPGQTFDLHTQVNRQRLVEKGIEVDLVSRLMRAGVCCWEGRTTFFHRGRFGDAAAVEPETAAPNLSDAALVERFRVPDGGGWGFGKLTGDYNGLHSWNWYARRLGFPRAFPHPQRVAAMCLSTLQGPQTDTQSLDLWIKGPVFYGAEVVLNAVRGDSGVCFGLALNSDPRHALLGRWNGGAADLT